MRQLAPQQSRDVSERSACKQQAKHAAHLAHVPMWRPPCPCKPTALQHSCRMPSRSRRASCNCYRKTAAEGLPIQVFPAGIARSSSRLFSSCGRSPDLFKSPNSSHIHQRQHQHQHVTRTALLARAAPSVFVEAAAAGGDTASQGQHPQRQQYSQQQRIEELLQLIKSKGVEVPDQVVHNQRYRCVCPFCEGGSTSEASFSWFIDPSGPTAPYKCFRGSCGEDGAFKVDSHARAKRHSTSEGTAAVRRWAAGHASQPLSSPSLQLFPRPSLQQHSNTPQQQGTAAQAQPGAPLIDHRQAALAWVQALGFDQSTLLACGVCTGVPPAEAYASEAAACGGSAAGDAGADGQQQQQRQRQQQQRQGASGQQSHQGPQNPPPEPDPVPCVVFRYEGSDGQLRNASFVQHTSPAALALAAAAAAAMKARGAASAAVSLQSSGTIPGGAGGSSTIPAGIGAGAAPGAAADITSSREPAQQQRNHALSSGSSAPGISIPPTSSLGPWMFPWAPRLMWGQAEVAAGMAAREQQRAAAEAAEAAAAAAAAGAAAADAKSSGLLVGGRQSRRRQQQIQAADQQAEREAREFVLHELNSSTYEADRVQYDAGDTLVIVQDEWDRMALVQAGFPPSAILSLPPWSPEDYAALLQQRQQMHEQQAAQAQAQAAAGDAASHAYYSDEPRWLRYAQRKAQLEQLQELEDSVFAYLAAAEEVVDSFPHVVLALHGGEGSQRLEEELARRLGRERCWRVRWPTGVQHLPASSPWAQLRHQQQYQQQYQQHQTAGSANDASSVGGSGAATVTQESAASAAPPDAARRSALEVLLLDGKEALVELMHGAQQWPIKGLFKFSEYGEALYEDYHRLRPYACGQSTGWPGMDPLYKVVPGELTLITGVPNMGKSEWLDALCVNLAEEVGWSIAMCSFEKSPVDHVKSLLEKYVRAPFVKGRSEPKMTEEELQLGMDFVQQHFVFIRFDGTDPLQHLSGSSSARRLQPLLPPPGEGAGGGEEGATEQTPTIDHVLDLARTAVSRHGIRGLVIDPYNELDHARPRNTTETEYVSRMLGKVKRFAQRYEVHVWFVAHPRQLPDWKGSPPTLYDISGSAHFVNKCDVGVVVHRNLGGTAPNLQPDEVLIKTLKVRNKASGSLGEYKLRYNRDDGTYSDDVEQ